MEYIDALKEEEEEDDEENAYTSTTAAADSDTIDIREFIVRILLFVKMLPLQEIERVLCFDVCFCFCFVAAANKVLTWGLISNESKNPSFNTEHLE